MKGKTETFARGFWAMAAMLAIAVGPRIAGCAVFEDRLEAAVQPEQAAVAETAGGLLIDTTGWDDLSREVIPHVLENNLDMGTVLRYAKSASCRVDVAIKTPQITMPELGGFTVPPGPPSTARVGLSWEDADDDGTLAEEEVKAETGYTSDIMMKMAMERIEKGLRNLVLLSVVNLLPQSSVKTERKGEEYEITVNPKKGPPVPMRLTVSGDFRITGTEFRTLGAVDTKATLKHVRKAGKWLLTEIDTSTSAGTPQASSEKWAIEFRMEAGMPLLSRISIAGVSPTISGTLRTEQEYAFSDWRVVKRDQPMEVVAAPVKTEEPVAEPRRAVPGVTERPSPRVNIARSQQANNLARETISSVGRAYYDLSTADVTGYDATFALQRDGRTVGSFRLRWEAFGGISVEPEQGQPEEMKGLAEFLAREVASVVAGGPLSEYSLAGDAYAGRSVNQTIIDATKHTAASDPNIKSDVVFVSPDLRQIRTTRTMNNGQTSERQYDGEEFEGKLFVSSTTDTLSDPGATPQSTEYTWTYTKRYGEPFVRSLKWSGTAGGQSGDWAMLLQNVTFQKEVARIKIDAGPAERAKLAREVKVPHTEEASKLAREVLTSLEKKFYNLISAGVSGFEASYAMEVGGKAIGTLKATWDLSGGDPTVGLEGLPEKAPEAQVKAVKMLAELHGYSALTALLGISGAAAGPGAYAIKSGNEYVVDFVEQSPKGGVDAEVAVAYIPENLTEYRDLVVAKGGTIVERSYHGELREGKFVATSFTMTKGAPGSEAMKSAFALTYAKKDGELFINRFETEEEMGGRKVPLTAVLNDVTLKKEALAAGEPDTAEWGPFPSMEELKKLAEEAKVPRTEEAKKLAEKVISSVQEGCYSFLEMAAIEFEARLNVSFMGRPLGIAGLKWDTVNGLSVEIIEAKDARPAAQDLLKLITKDMGGEIVRIFARPPVIEYYADCYAVEEGDQFTVDATELATRLDPEVKTQLLFVSTDLRRLRTAVIEKDGSMTLRADNREKIEGKELITSSAVWVIRPGKDSISLEYKWTYGQEAGATFIKTIRHRRDVSGRKVTFAAALDNVKLERFGTPEQPKVTEPRVTTGVPSVEEARKLAQETNIPRTEESRQLAQQVIRSVQQKYHSVFHLTNVSGFQVTASVKKDDYDVGNIKITWKRDDPENPDAKTEKKVEDPVAMLIQGMATELAAIDVLMPFVLGPLRSAQALEGYAAKSGGLYVLDLTEAAKSDNLKARILCVPQDFSRVQETRTYKDGDVLEWVFNGEAGDGTVLLSSATQPLSPPLGGDYEPTNFSWTYSRKGGRIFIEKAQVDQPLMGQVMHWTIEFGDASFQGGGNVPDIPEDIQKAREQALKDLDEQTRKALEDAMEQELEKIKEQGP